MGHILEDLGQGSILPQSPHLSSKHIPQSGVCRFHISLSQLAGGGLLLPSHTIEIGQAGRLCAMAGGWESHSG